MARIRKGFLLASVLLIPAAGVYAQEAGPAGITHPELRTVLLSMHEIDQAVREELVGKGFGNLNSLDLTRQQAVDDTNVRLLSKMIQEYGWPDRAMVGLDGVKAAFTITQRGSHTFQKSMLPHVRRAYEVGELPAGDYAVLIDRVLIGDGYPQRYGTQAEIRNGELVFFPLEHPFSLDERRRELGLEPMNEYIAKLENLYGAPARRPLY